MRAAETALLRMSVYVVHATYEWQEFLEGRGPSPGLHWEEVSGCLGLFPWGLRRGPFSYPDFAHSLQSFLDSPQVFFFWLSHFHQRNGSLVSLTIFN